jgi:iron complex outermembrane receptor protein
MERTRFDTELAIFEPTDWIEALRVRFGYTDYQHIELHGEEEAHAHDHEEDHDEEHGHEEGTVFDREGWELRAEASHYEWAIFDQGIFGIQISDTDFEATGEEIESDEGFAFGPPSTTRNQAVFISEHIHGEHVHLDIGGRLERQTIDVSGEDYNDVAASLAFGAIWPINERNSLALSLQRTERHPNATELYANGPHLATGTFEVGDADLRLETAYGADITFRHNNDDWNAVASVFYTYFDNYIFSADSGMEEDGLPVFHYNEVEALFYGLELELNYLLYQSADTRLSVGLLADHVQARNEDDNTDLPRIPPFRLGGKAELAHGNWNAGLLLRHSFEQNDTAPEETETDGFTELQAEIGYVFDINSRSSLTLFARANNLLDEEIRHHTSFIKDEAPRPGRNVTLGARFEF